MKPLHDARLMVPALGAYLCAYLVASDKLSGAPLRWVVSGSAVIALVVAICHALGRARSRATAPYQTSPRSGGQTWWAHVMLTCAVIAVVGWVAMAHAAHRWEGGIVHVVGDHAPEVQLAAVAVREPVPIGVDRYDASPRVRLELAVTRWRTTAQDNGANARDGAAPAPEWHESVARVVVIGGDKLGAVEYGDHVSIATQLTPSRGGREVAIGWSSTLLERHPATGHERWVAVIREGFRRATAPPSSPVRGLTRGMVIGDTRDMPQVQRDAMQITGLTHLTAVSGAHFAVVAVVLNGLLRRARLGRLVRALAASAAMACFAALVFPDPSVVRALVMALIGAVAVAWGRPAQALPALAWTVILLVLADPYVSLEMGLVLSVAAVGAIVLWAPRLRSLLATVMAPLPAMLISVPLAAQAVCAPILIMAEPRVSMYAVIANMLAAPFAAPVTVLGLVTVLVGPVWPALATAGAWVVSLAVWPVVWVARVLASLPGAAVAWPPGAMGATLLATMTGVAMWWTVPRGKVVVKAAVSGVLVIGTVLVAQSQATWDWVNPPPSAWALVACDVGQGDMMLLGTEPGSAIVIDTGPGDGTARACLNRFGVHHVPLLILTHPHADHDGGVAELLDLVDVDQAWLPAVALEPGLAGAARLLVDAGIEVVVPRNGDSWRDNGIELTVRQGGLAASTLNAQRRLPPTSWAAGAHAMDVSTSRFDGTEVNDSSLVVAGKVHDVTFLALGDVESRAQAALARRLVGILPLDVVKIPHHGSRTQDPDLVSHLGPRVAIASLGASNTYGHPAASTLELYQDTGAVVVRTDLCGDIALWRDPQLRLASTCQSRMAG